MALQDEILPLSKPILTESGDMINEVPVPKGTEIVVSIAAYNRWVLLSHKHIHFGRVIERGIAVIKTSGERMHTSSNPIAGWMTL